MHFYCLVNPRSGNLSGTRLLGTLLHLKNIGHFKGEIVEIDLANIANQINEGLRFDGILIAGGDGTVSFVLSHLPGKKIPVGILPIGTANDLARELGLCRHFSIQDPNRILNIYQKGVVKDFYVWKLSYGNEYALSTLFCNYVSWGFEGKVVTDFASWRKHQDKVAHRFGVWRNRYHYAVFALKNLFYKLPLSGIQILRNREVLGLDSPTCRSLHLTNIRHSLGLCISNPQSSPFDQNIELMLSTSLLDYISMLTHYRVPLLPTPSLLGGASSWEIIGLPEDMPLQIDGETKPEIRSSNYHITMSHTVKLLVP